MPFKQTPNKSFCTLEEAEEYFTERLHTEAWHSAGDNDKGVALIQAARIFNTWLAWKEPEETDSADEREPEDALKWATCEMALYLLQEDPLAKDSMEGLSRIKLGELEIEKAAGRKSVIPAYIFAMIAHLADLAVSGCTIEVKRS